MQTKYVTVESFSQVLDLLKENREDFREQIKENRELMREHIKELSTQLQEVGQAITERQDIQNGRMVKAEEAIEDIRAEVDEILMEGCHQRDKHVAAIKTLADAGVLEEVAVETPPKWKSHARKAGIGGLLVGAGALAPHVWEIIHSLFHVTPVAK